MVERFERDSARTRCGDRDASDGAGAKAAVSLFVRDPEFQAHAFDPRRTAILLLGGDKTGDDRFYDRMIPAADKLYDVYIEELKREGLI